MGGEEGGESLVEVGIDQAVDAAFGDGAEGGEGDGGGIEGERERRAVEVAAGDDVAARRRKTSGLSVAEPVSISTV